MWLLSTERAELHYFVSPEAVHLGYAILSHVWGKQETSFQEHKELIQRCNAMNMNPRDHASEKIRRCCELAHSHGFKWIWNDTCCIDKSSSAELSEAINSMFRYYAMSQVCYAYLRDVPQTPRLRLHSGVFQNSTWHSRAWTLQELIAPRTVLLLSKDWAVLGTKVDLAPNLELATGIPASLLRLERSVGEFSIAQRMSWAARRHATRVEDTAYSLMGIFGINMPTLYGEGENAFLRLQEEILRKSTDTTLLAWGGWGQTDTSSFRRWRRKDSHLFAPSPNAFLGHEGISYTAFTSRIELLSDSTTRIQDCGAPSFDLSGQERFTLTRTPDGILAHTRIMGLSANPQGRDLCVADLGWSISESIHSDRVFLIVWLSLHTPSAFTTGAHEVPSQALDRDSFRLIRVPRGMPLAFFANAEPWKWSDVYLLQDTSPVEGDHPIPTFPINHSLLAPFHFPEDHVRTFMRSFIRSIRGRECRLASVSSISVPWTGQPPAMFAFHFLDRTGHFWTSGYVLIQVGLCYNVVSSQSEPAAIPDHGSEITRQLWARALPGSSDAETVTSGFTMTTELPHQCPADHVAEWHLGRRCFLIRPLDPPVKNGQWHVVLSFSPSLSLSSRAMDLKVSLGESLGLCYVCRPLTRP